MYCFLEYMDIKSCKLPNENLSEQLTINESLAAISSIAENKKMLFNPNCPIQILLDYINEETGLDKAIEYDFCDAETGILLHIFTLRPWNYATDLMQPQKTYVIIFYEKNILGEYTKLEPFLNKNSTEHADVMLKIKKQMGSITRRRSSGSRKYKKDSLTSKTSTKGTEKTEKRHSHSKTKKNV